MTDIKNVVMFCIVCLISFALLITLLLVLSKDNEGPGKSTIGAIAYIFPIVITIILSYVPIYQLTTVIFSRWFFHIRAAKIYKKANESDNVFAITDTYDLPKRYEKAYKDCKAAKIHFFGPVEMKSPTILGVLARIGLLREDRNDEKFCLKKVPRDAFEIMPPKLAGSNRKVLFGEEIERGPTKNGWYVESDALGEFLWRHIETLSKDWSDAEDYIANYLDETFGGAEPQNKEPVFQHVKEIVEKLVSHSVIKKYWDKPFNKRAESVKKLAQKGLEHIISEHCSKLKLQSQKVYSNST